MPHKLDRAQQIHNLRKIVLTMGGIAFKQLSNIADIVRTSVDNNRI